MPKPKEHVVHPSHYNQHPSGIECMDVVKHMDFCLGNVIKYVWRSEYKGNQLEDLRKAMVYLQTKINMLEQGEKS